LLSEEIRISVRFKVSAAVTEKTSLARLFARLVCFTFLKMEAVRSSGMPASFDQTTGVHIQEYSKAIPVTGHGGP
jgi:hypothetical protein